MRLVLQRHTGPLAAMGHGLWMSDPSQHKPGSRIAVFVSCPGDGYDCGSIMEVDPANVSAGGLVVDTLYCQAPRCEFARLVTLEGWGEPVFAFDESDVKP